MLIKIIIIIQMSELYLKRQKLAKMARRASFEQFVSNFRKEAHLMVFQQHNFLSEEDIYYMQKAIENESLSLNEIKPIMSLLENKRYQGQIYPCYPILIFNVLNRLYKINELDYGMPIFKSIFKRIMNDAISSPQVIDQCYDDLFSIISDQRFQFIQIWPIIALIRSQQFFSKSFMYFVQYVSEKDMQPEENLSSKISYILQTLINFSIVNKSHSLQLGVEQAYYGIIVIKMLLSKYELSEKDDRLALRALSSMFQGPDIDHILPNFLQIKILPFIVKMMNNEQKYCRLEILRLFAKILSAQNEQSISKFLQPENKVIDCILYVLPNQTFQIINDQVPKKIDNLEELLNALLCLSNIAANQNCSIILMGGSIIKRLISLSEYPDEKLWYELIHVFYNLTIKAEQDEKIQILCQQNILKAIANILRSQYYPENIDLAVQSLFRIVMRVKKIEKKDFQWIYTLDRIKNQAKSLQIVKELQHLLIIENYKLRDQVQAILNQLTDKQEQFV